MSDAALGSRTLKWCASFRTHRWEWLFMAVLITGLIWNGYQYSRIGYLPLPFFPDPNDTYGDGYNTSWWGFNGGVYDVWHTVYPPLSFVLAKAFGVSRCYARDVDLTRDCDWGLWTGGVVFYILNGMIAARAYWLKDRTTVVPRTIALIFGLPMLSAFQHLNFIIFAYTGMFIAFSPVFRSTWLRWLGIAVAINLKVYFVIVLLGQLINRRWRWVEGGLAVALAVALASWAIVGEGTPAELYRNITVFSNDSNRASSWLSVVYAASYDSMIQFLSSNFPLMPIIGSWWVEFSIIALTALIRITQTISLLALAAAWLRPAAVSRMRIATLCYLFVLVSIEPGGYAIAGAVFLIFFERWQGAARIIALVSAYWLCLSFDIEMVPVGFNPTIESYLAGRKVWQDLWLTAGPLIRPGLVIVAQLALVAATFGDVRRYIRESEPAPDASLIPA